VLDHLIHHLMEGNRDANLLFIGDLLFIRKYDDE